MPPPLSPPPPLGRIVMYTHKLDEMAAFYTRHFGFTAVRTPGDRIVELHPVAGGAAILLHAAAKGQKPGQVLVKLVFDVADVAGEVARQAALGLDFGPLHQADGYQFANAKDPSGNPINLSGRAFAAR